MRRGKLLAFAVLALLAFASALVSSGYGALLEILPENAGRSGTGKAVGATAFSILGSETIVSCSGSTGTGTEVSSKPPSGTTTIDFTTCSIAKPISGVCTGLGEAAGVILSPVAWEVVFDTNPTGTLTTAVLSTNSSDVHFICGGLVLVVIKAGGQGLCLANNPTVKSKSHEATCATNGTLGDPLETKYWNSAGTEKTITELLSSVSGGAFTMSALAGKGVVETVEEISADQ
jgi:hypothetical protein